MRYGSAKKIRLLIVDDSVLFRNILASRLSEDPGIEIIGRAVDAEDALEKIDHLKPDVVTLDIEMPGMNGIELLKILSVKHPIPVVLVSSLNISVFDALSAGAVDFVRKPDMGNTRSSEEFFRELTGKVKIAASARMRPQPAVPVARPALAGMPVGTLDSFVIAIGASTGGTEATIAVVRDLPVSTPGIVVVQHMPPGFTKMYADRLNGICKMEVREARDGDEVKRGLILVAPGDLHMTVVKSGARHTVRCYDAEKVCGHRPSVDVLFNSVAEQIKGKSIGIILTGMGKDGASGLLKMRKAGAYTIGQDEASCVVYGMPMVAYNIGGVSLQASLNRIPDVLSNQLRKMG